VWYSILHSCNCIRWSVDDLSSFFDKQILICRPLLDTCLVPDVRVSWYPTITSLAATMLVNGLVTGLAVYKILQVFLEVSTSVEQTGCFAMQLVRIVLVVGA
jgi:hypothetical protein